MGSWAANQAHVRVSLIPKQTKMLRSYGRISICSSTLSIRRSTYSGQKWCLLGRKRSQSVQTFVRTLPNRSDCLSRHFVPRCGEDHSMEEAQKKGPKLTSFFSLFH